MFKEVWKDVPDYEGYYQVSNLGNVKSVKKNRNLKMLVTNRGYHRVDLSKNNVVKHHQVHRLVIIAFKGYDANPERNCVNHKDENPRNNNLDNLEWVTTKENTNYGTGLYRRGLKRQKPIYAVDKTGKKQPFESIKTCSSKLNLSSAHIVQVLKGQRPSHKGYTFEYIR